MGTNPSKCISIQCLHVFCAIIQKVDLFFLYFIDHYVYLESIRGLGESNLFSTRLAGRHQGVMKLHLANTSTMWVGKLILNSISVSLETVKNCHRRLYCKSSLAGYWVKFSTSNNRASVRPHRLRYCRCAKIDTEWLTEHLVFDNNLLHKGIMRKFLNNWL